MSKHEALMNVLKIRGNDLTNALKEIKSAPGLNLSNERLDKAIKMIDEGLYLVEAAVAIAEKETREKAI